MKSSVIFPILILLLTSQMALGQEFHSRVDDATAVAQTENKNVLLVFTGSDWCKPCILLKRDILHSPAFVEFAEESLVLVNLDFPYQRKNKLPKEQEAYNASMADRFNPEGKFPRAILLDPQGEIIREIEYKPGMEGSTFMQNIL